MNIKYPLVKIINYQRPIKYIELKYLIKYTESDKDLIKYIYPNKDLIKYRYPIKDIIKYRYPIKDKNSIMYDFYKWVLKFLRIN
jgi:hypothetical protein